MHSPMVESRFRICCCHNQASSKGTAHSVQMVFLLKLTVNNYTLDKNMDGRTPGSCVTRRSWLGFEFLSLFTTT